MDGLRFDALTRLIGTTRSRRDAFRSALGATTVAVAGVSLRNAAGVEAKNKGKRKRKKKKPFVCLDAGASCANSAECCPDTTRRLCEVLDNPGSSKTCCGGNGAVCGGLNNEENPAPPFCCKNFGCNKITKTCVSLPE